MIFRYTDLGSIVNHVEYCPTYHSVMQYNKEQTFRKDNQAIHLEEFSDT